MSENAIPFDEFISQIRAEVMRDLNALRTECESNLDKLRNDAETDSLQIAEWGFDGKHLTIELLDGKHDGMILDSQSGDPTERELVGLLRCSHNFVQVQKVETDTAVFVQLRPIRR